MTLGMRIKLARTEKGWSQSVLADELTTADQEAKTYQDAVSRWERNDSRPTARQLVRMADLFGWSADDVLRWAVT